MLNNDFSQGKDVVFGLAQGRVGMKIPVLFRSIGNGGIYLVKFLDKKQHEIRLCVGCNMRVPEDNLAFFREEYD